MKAIVIKNKKRYEDVLAIHLKDNSEDVNQQVVYVDRKNENAPRICCDSFPGEVDLEIDGKIVK